jgi:hypothetical protein
MHPISNTATTEASTLRTYTRPSSQSALTVRNTEQENVSMKPILWLNRD